MSSKPKSINYMTVPGVATSQELTFKRRHTMDELAEIISKHTGIPVALMMSKCRKREYVEARQLVYYLAVKIVRPAYSLSRAGTFFGQDHATVLHSCRQVVDLMHSDKQYHHRLLKIIEDLRL